MKIIETQQEFEEVLALEKCLVLASADWSASSVITERKVQAWMNVHDTRNDVSNIEVLKIDSHAEVFNKWLLAQDADELQDIISIQNGVLVWMQHGKPRGWLRSQHITEQSIDEWVAIVSSM